MRKGLRIFCCLFALFIGLSGCQSVGVLPVYEFNDGNTTLPGFLPANEVLSGGQAIVGLNLYDFEIGSAQGNTIITITFMQGSLVMGLDEKPAPGVPAYELSALEGLNRLVLRVQDLAFWDYTVFDAELEQSAVLGVSRQLPVNSSTTELYISINDEFVYNAEERANQLIITLRTLNKSEEASWYALADLTEEYINGQIEGIGMTPIPCSDRQNSVLVSQPFETEEQAQSFAQMKTKTYPEVFEKKTLSVMKMVKGTLPDFNQIGIVQSLTNSPVGEKEGEKITVPALVNNGRLLAWREDSDTFAFTRPYFLSEGDEVVSTYEKLFISNYIDPAEQLVLEFEFENLHDAAFSPDGRKLAFVDHGANERILYIYDFDNDLLISAPEEGVGTDTSDFAWADDHTLYSLSGDVNETFLYKFVFDSAFEYTVTADEENIYSAGDLACADGKLYLVKPDTEAGKEQILRIDLQTRQTDVLCTGYGFVLSPDGKKIAVLADTQERGFSSLILLEPASGQQKTVEESIQIVDMVWLNDSSGLCYTVYRDDENDVEFPTALFCYANGRTAQICNLVSGSLSSSAQPGEVLLCRIYAEEGQFIPVTYCIPVQ